MFSGDCHASVCLVTPTELMFAFLVLLRAAWTDTPVSRVRSVDSELGFSLHPARVGEASWNGEAGGRQTRCKNSRQPFFRTLRRLRYSPGGAGRARRYLHQSALR